MIKVVFGWADRPGMSEAECDRLYRANHIPLATKLYEDAPGFRKLVYNRVTSHLVFNYNNPDDVEQRAPDMNAFIELYFDDQESLAAALSKSDIEALYADHVNWMDIDRPANVRTYYVDETVVLTRDGD